MARFRRCRSRDSTTRSDLSRTDGQANVCRMRFVVAGGGVAGLATALAAGRAGHEVVVLERDVVDRASLRWTRSRSSAPASRITCSRMRSCPARSDAVTSDSGGV